MKIPIKNLFYLLCYAWDVIETGDVTEVCESEAPNLEDLLASVLITRMERQIRRGLEQDYHERREDWSCIRGRIDFPETIKRQLLRRSEAHVIFDELSPDTLANRIVKATIRSLLRFKTLDPRNQKALNGLFRGLRDVSDVRVSAASFYRVRLHRNNQDYRVLLNICRMIQDYVLPDQNGNGTRFVEFERDEDRMWKVFQTFLTRFYQKRQDRYRVESSWFDWQVSQSPEKETFLLPKLKTDIVLSDQKSRIVLDAKFYKEPFKSQYEKVTADPDHVNQMFVYMQNAAASDARQRQVDGIILYATSLGVPFQDWKMFGHNLRIAGVDLSQHWNDIDKSLLSIVNIN